MSCPDEDTFARFVEGLLLPADSAALERHLDTCPRCADLAAEFGRSFAEGGGGSDASGAGGAGGRGGDAGRADAGGPDAEGAAAARLLPVALLAGAALHVAWGLVLRGGAGAL